MNLLGACDNGRRRALRLVATGVGAGLAVLATRPVIAGAGGLLPVTVYKEPNCGCCGLWADYLRAHGFAVKVVMTEDLNPVKQMARVPEELQTCHTAFIGSYVIEGHVPVPAIMKLLDERPNIPGIAVPGMPAGSPGMPSDRPEPYDVFAYSADGNARVYMSF